MINASSPLSPCTVGIKVKDLSRQKFNVIHAFYHPKIKLTPRYPLQPSKTSKEGRIKINPCDLFCGSPVA